MNDIKKMLEGLKDNDGATLYEYRDVKYVSGYQVATEGLEATTIDRAEQFIKYYNGTCGVWLENGIYYIDKSKRISTKKEALKIGRECNQISIYDWKNKKLIYC